jgi:hypothetical protein
MITKKKTPLKNCQKHQQKAVAKKNNSKKTSSKKKEIKWNLIF